MGTLVWWRGGCCLKNGHTSPPDNVRKRPAWDSAWRALREWTAVMYGGGHPLLEVKTPRGNNERIYEAEAFFMPLNMLPPDTSLDSRMKYNQAAGFNHYNAHRTHISWPIKPRKYLKATQVGTSFTSLCAQCCLDADFFFPFLLFANL